MWLFTDFGYLLPTITTENDPMRKHADWDHYSVDDTLTFQVRSRLKEHLDYYLANFAEPGTYGPVWRTPDHDYNYRVFTTQEAFAQATAKMVMAIDYRNFKDQSTKFPRGEEYHSLLLRIWGASCDLGEGPGGFYGPQSDENPNGYDAAHRYSSWGSGDYSGRRIGDSFQNIDFGDAYEDAWAEIREQEQDTRILKLMEEMEECGVDMEDWHMNMLPSEFEAMVPILRQYYGKKKVKRWAAENKRAFA